MSAAKELHCFQCSAVIPVIGIVGFRDECPKCRADVHCCRNCAHHDPKIYNECKEPQADVVKERDRANFCDFFTPGSGKGGVDKTQDLLSAAEALFKKK